MKSFLTLISNLINESTVSDLMLTPVFGCHMQDTNREALYWSIQKACLCDTSFNVHELLFTYFIFLKLCMILHGETMKNPT